MCHGSLCKTFPPFLFLAQQNPLDIALCNSDAMSNSIEQVRAKCTETMGRLVMEYSSKFLDNQYLKYIGWALYDKSKDVRLAALDAVDALYKAKNFINSLEAFTNRFRWCALGLGYLKRECMLFSGVMC
jgi:hypothetical protein